jgi:type I restriction enzyme, R subunit
MKTLETDARITIDKQLRTAQWDIEDKTQVKTEVSVASGGRADYVLYDKRGRALAVVEAKKFAVDPYIAKGQAKIYANELNVDFIFLSNGEVIYFWDYKNNDARIVNGFFSRADLERMSFLRKQKSIKLKNIPIDKNIAGRKYQEQCLHKIDATLAAGKRKILVEMATGTGKTRLVVAQIKRLFKSRKVEKVLFLVDRKELAKQAKAAFEEFLGDEYDSYILKAGAKKLEKGITITTLQTMIGMYKEFTPAYFDFIVIDECHRSIYGKWRYILIHFDAIQLGLTATPSEMIDRNTYDFFDCKRPIFTYGIRKAIDDNFLSGYRIYRALTDISLHGVSYEDEDYNPMQLERRINVPDRNKKIVTEFKEKARLGKTIVFAVTKRHAAQLARFFNEAYPEFKGNYAKVITSDTLDPDQAIMDFKKEKLPMIAVSVGMLDTGFDCPEIINLVMARPTRSPILYQQMRGRGTRPESTCKYKKLLPNGKKDYFTLFDFVGNTIFFNDDNYDPHNYGGSSGGVSPKATGKSSWMYESETAQSRELVVAEDIKDTFVKREEIEIGPEGEKVDIRDYRDEFKSKISKLMETNKIIQKIKTGKLITDTEIDKLSKELNSPKYFFNELNLRDAYDEPVSDLIDFIKHVLGLYKFSTREDRIKSNFDAFVTEHNFSPDQVRFLNVWKNKFVVSKKADILDFNHYPPLRQMGGLTKAQQMFGDKLPDIVRDINGGVFVG